MKKQYRDVDYTFGRKLLHIYHDGKCIETKKLWIDDALDEIEKLENEGYAYGYLSGEVEK